MNPIFGIRRIGFLTIVFSSLLGGCVSVQSKGGLPADWQVAMQAKTVADISGEYRFYGEGSVVPDPRITAFLPDHGILTAKSFTLRQIDATHLEVLMAENGSTPFLVEVQSNPETGEVTIPPFSETDTSGYLPSHTSVKVVFKKGADGALYANRVSKTVGSAEKIMLPMAGILGRWCRFLPVGPSAHRP